MPKNVDKLVRDVAESFTSPFTVENVQQRIIDRDYKEVPSKTTIYWSMRRYVRRVGQLQINLPGGRDRRPSLYEVI